MKKRSEEIGKYTSGRMQTCALIFYVISSDDEKETYMVHVVDC